MIDDKPMEKEFVSEFDKLLIQMSFKEFKHPGNSQDGLHSIQIGSYRYKGRDYRVIITQENIYIEFDPSTILRDLRPWHIYCERIEMCIDKEMDKRG